MAGAKSFSYRRERAPASHLLGSYATILVSEVSKVLLVLVQKQIVLHYVPPVTFQAAHNYGSVALKGDQGEVLLSVERTLTPTLPLHENLQGVRKARCLETSGLPSCTDQAQVPIG